MKTKHSPLVAVLAVSTLCLTLAAMASAQDRPQRRRPGSRTDAQKADSQKPAEKKPATPKPAEKPTLAVVGGDILTVTNGTIRRGTILIRDGRIVEVGQGITVPEGATVIDATGQIVTPGFITLSAGGVGMGRGSSADKVIDQLDPFDPNVRLSLGVGITTACVQTGGSSGRFRRRAPSEMDTPSQFLGLEASDERQLADYNEDFGDPNTSVCPCCGLPILSTAAEVRPQPTAVTETKHAVIKMSAGSLDGMLVSEGAFLHLSAGSLAGRLNRHKWRQTVAAARLYLKELAEHEAKLKAGDKNSKAPKKPVSDALLQLVRKEIALRTSAATVDSIRDMIELAKELDYRLVLDGVTEGWVLPQELSDADVSVVITPRARRSAQLGEEDRSGSNIESSRIFEEAGVPFAIAPLSSRISLNGLAGRDLTSLPLEAAFAVRGGCSEKTGLEALTIIPARMMGLEKRLGSIEVGKDADLLLLNGQPLDYRTYVETAIVNGRVAYERARDRVWPVYDRD